MIKNHSAGINTQLSSVRSLGKPHLGTRIPHWGLYAQATHTIWLWYSLVEKGGKKNCGQQGLSSPTDTCKFAMLVSSDTSSWISGKFTPKSDMWRSHCYFSFPLLINHIPSKTKVTTESSRANFLLVFYQKEKKLLEGSDSWSHLCTSSFSTPVPLWHQCQFFSPAVPWGCVNRKATSRLNSRKSQLITACTVSCMCNELLIIGEN